VIRDWMSGAGETKRKKEKKGVLAGSPFVHKDRLRAFLKDPLLKELWNYST
jgi:hypothetical protein